MKLTSTNFNFSDDETIKEQYTKNQKIEFFEDMLDSYITLLSTKADAVGVSISSTGSINPKHFKTHRKLGGDVGLKIWVSEDWLY